MENDQIIKTTIKQADQHLFDAEEELCRPEEDVVPYMACRGAYKAVNHYLVGYLLKHGMEINASMSLDFLLDTCRAIEPQFAELNLDPLYNTNIHEHDDVFMDMDTVKEFMGIASQTKILVKQLIN